MISGPVVNFEKIMVMQARRQTFLEIGLIPSFAGPQSGCHPEPQS